MKRWRTIIMSDLHLGSRQSQTDKILEFLNENESDTLILNGDIIDGWALKSKGKWKKDCSKIFRRFMKRSEEGTKVIYRAYIAGEHIGYFTDPTEAGRAYDEEAISRFGEFARTNASMGLL